jgi:ABC-type dipeptide/oligopeptide/nickel transport system ATPase component
MQRITIDEPPVIHHKSSVFRDGFLSMAIIGKSGCGKTRMLAEILPSISDSIDTVIIASVMAGVPLHNAIVKYFNAIPGKVAGISHSPDEMREIVDQCEELDEVNPEHQGLIIFDDFNTGKATGPYWDFTIHAFTKLRNNGWNFIIIAQQPQFIPTIVRNCTTARVLFDCYCKTALTTFTKDVADRISDRNAYDTMIDYIRACPYTYMLVQEHPFEISAGTLGKTKSVIRENSVNIPTLRELEREMHVNSRRGLDTKSREAQVNAGNTFQKYYR